MSNNSATCNACGSKDTVSIEKTESVSACPGFSEMLSLTLPHTHCNACNRDFVSNAQIKISDELVKAARLNWRKMRGKNRGRLMGDIVSKVTMVLDKDPNLTLIEVSERVGFNHTHVACGLTDAKTSWMDIKIRYFEQDEFINSLVEQLIVYPNLNLNDLSLNLKLSNGHIREELEKRGIRLRELKIYCARLRDLTPRGWLSVPISTMVFVYKNVDARILA